MLKIPFILGILVITLTICLATPDKEPFHRDRKDYHHSAIKGQLTKQSFFNTEGFRPVKSKHYGSSHGLRQDQGKGVSSRTVFGYSDRKRYERVGLGGHSDNKPYTEPHAYRRTEGKKLGLEHSLGDRSTYGASKGYDVTRGSGYSTKGYTTKREHETVAPLNRVYSNTKVPGYGDSKEYRRTEGDKYDHGRGYRRTEGDKYGHSRGYRRTDGDKDDHSRGYRRTEENKYDHGRGYRRTEGDTYDHSRGYRRTEESGYGDSKGYTRSDGYKYDDSKPYVTKGPGYGENKGYRRDERLQYGDSKGYGRSDRLGYDDNKGAHRNAEPGYGDRKGYKSDGPLYGDSTHYSKTAQPGYGERDGYRSDKEAERRGYGSTSGYAANKQYGSSSRLGYQDNIRQPPSRVPQASRSIAYIDDRGPLRGYKPTRAPKYALIRYHSPRDYVPAPRHSDSMRYRPRREFGRSSIHPAGLGAKRGYSDRKVQGLRDTDGYRYNFGDRKDSYRPSGSKEYEAQEDRSYGNGYDNRRDRYDPPYERQVYRDNRRRYA